MRRSILSIAYVLLVTLVLSACGAAPTSVASTPTPAPTPTVLGGTSLRDLAQSHHLAIGTTVNIQAFLRDPLYTDELGQLFNMMTPENSMKFDNIEPQQGVFDFKPTDALVTYALAHHMQIRGHNFVWDQNLPYWLTGGHFTQAQYMAILKNHITTVMKHYRGQIEIWDVVNEAVDDGGWLKKDFWLNVLGPDYIALAFRWAHEADPQAHLFYNEVNVDGLGFKSDFVYQMLATLLKSGVPIYGVGLEMHHTIYSYPQAQDILTNMRRLAALGLKIQITEMDISLRQDLSQSTTVPLVPTTQQLTLQASIYHDTLATCLKVSACQAFMMWGFTDRYSWLNGNGLTPTHIDAPLIFDENYQPKPAYTALVQALEGA